MKRSSQTTLAANEVAASRITLVIEPGMTAKNYWHDLWRYRELV